MSPTTLALAMIVMFLPFLSVSCGAPGGFGRVTQGGTTSYSGVNLALGSDPSVTAENLRSPNEAQDDNIGLQPAMVIGAIACVLVVRSRPIDDTPDQHDLDRSTT